MTRGVTKGLHIVRIQVPVGRLLGSHPDSGDPEGTVSPGRERECVFPKTMISFRPRGTLVVINVTDGVSLRVIGRLVQVSSRAILVQYV